MVSRFLMPVVNRIVMLALVIATLGATGDSSKPSIPAKKITREIVPGVMYSKEYFPRTRWRVHTLTVDLSRPDIDLRVMKGLEHVAGLEKLQQMAERLDSLEPGLTVLAGINANFWSAGTHQVIGPMVKDGVFINHAKYKNWSSFVVDTSRSLYIDRYDLSITAATPFGLFTISEVNARTDSHTVSLYTRFYGPALPFVDTLGILTASRDTITDESESDSINGFILDSLWRVHPERSTLKLKFEYLSKPLANARVLCVLTGVDTSAVDIPENGGILSLGVMKVSPFMYYFAVGDTFSLASYSNPVLANPVLQMISGTPRLVRNGKVSVEWREEGLRKRSFVRGRYGRTAVGFSKNGKKLIFLSVERTNRASRTRGIPLANLARLIRARGAYQALNLDGGSSSTMVIRNKTVCPSAGSAYSRKVASGLFVVLRQGNAKDSIPSLQNPGNRY